MGRHLIQIVLYVFWNLVILYVYGLTSISHLILN